MPCEATFFLLYYKFIHMEYERSAITASLKLNSCGYPVLSENVNVVFFVA